MIADLFKVVDQNTTKNSKQILIWLCLSYGIFAVHFIGYPLWYQQPEFLCFDKTNELLKDVSSYEQLMGISKQDENLNSKLYYKCEEKIACQPNQGYVIDEEGTWSLKAQYQMVCENSYLEKESLAIVLRGLMVGCIFNLIFRTNPNYRKNILGFQDIIYGVFSIVSIFFDSNMHYVSYLFFGFHIIRMTNFGNYITLFTEKYNEELAKVAPSFIFIAMGLYGMMYPLVAYFVKSNWKVLMLFQGIPMIFFGYKIIISDFYEEQNILDQALLDTQQNKQGLLEGSKKKFFIFNLDQFQELAHNTGVLSNLIFLMIVFAAYCVGLLGLQIEMERLAGSIYLNLMMGAFFMLIGAVCGGIVLMKFNAYNSILWSYYICGLTLIIYIFAPLDLGEANIFNKIFWSIPGLVNIFTIECFIDVLIAILPAFFSVEIIPIYLGFTQLFTSIVCSFIPHIKEYMESIGLYPYVFYGIFIFVSGFIFQCFVKVDHDLINEVSRHLSQILSEDSILVGSFSLRSHILNLSYSSKNNDQIEQNSNQNDSGILIQRKGSSIQNYLNQVNKKERKTSNSIELT